MKKDVLFLCQFFYPEYISSATLPFDTAAALSKAGFSVGALCGYPKEYSLVNKVPLKEVHENILIKRIRYIQIKRSNFIGRLINYFSFVFAAALRFNELRKYKAVIVYSNPPILPLIAAMADKFFRTKVIFISYDVYPEIAIVPKSISENSIISKTMKKANKIIFRHVTKVTALSNEMKDYLLEHREALSDDKIEVIPNWYEDDKSLNSSEPVKNKQLIDLKSDGNIIVSYFGNMGICQDMDTILNAIRLVKNDDHIKFLFAGHGNKMTKLKEAVHQEELTNVTILDFLHGQDFADALKISDCFLVSLLKGLDGLCVPSKTYSYMAASKPIIAIMEKNFDIAKDLIENEAGFVVSQGESEALIECVKKLKENKQLQREIGQNCRNVYINNYTKAKCTYKYVNMMKKLLEE